MIGLESFVEERNVLAGIKPVHMIRKAPLITAQDSDLALANYNLLRLQPNCFHACLLDKTTKKRLLFR